MRTLVFIAALCFTAKDVYVLVRNSREKEGNRAVHVWFTALLWAVFLAA